jgi:hypothetical protein
MTYIQNGDRVPGDAALVSPHKVDRRFGSGRGEPLDKGQHRTDRRRELWGRPMSSSGRLSAEMMIMMIFKIRIATEVSNCR